jgi:hypothetical protein
MTTRAITKPEPPAWQPISTAPEGVPILTRLADANGVRNERVLRRDGRRWCDAGGLTCVGYTPTHWMAGGTRGGGA